MSDQQPAAPRAPLLPRVLIVLLTLWALIGYLIVPWLVHAFAPRIAADALDAGLEIGDVHFDPFALRLRMHEIVLRGPLDAPNFEPEPLVRIGLLDLNLSALSLLTLDPLLAVHMDAPDLRIERAGNGALNLAELIPLESEPAPEPDAGEAPPTLPRLTLALHIDDGRVHIIDRSRPQPFETRVTGIDLALDALQLQPGDGSAVDLVAELEGARLGLSGELSTRPEARMDLQLTAFPLALVNRWLADTAPVRDLSGLLDASAQLAYADGALRVDDGAATLSALAVGMDAPLRAGLGVERIAVRGVAGNPLQPDLEIESLEVRAPRIEAMYEADTIAALTAPPAEPSPATAPAPAPDATADGRTEPAAAGTTESDAGTAGTESNAAARAETAGSAPAPRVAVGSVRIGDMALAVTDRTLDGAPTLTLDRINVELGRIVPLGGSEEDPSTSLHVDLRAFGSGELSFDGTVALAPRLDGRLELADLDLTSLAPWVQHHVQLGLQRGAIELGMDVEYAESLLLSGDLHLGNLDLNDPGGVQLLAWSLLEVQGIELDTGERSARVESIALQGPAARFARLTDGSTNLDGIGSSAGTDTDTQAFADADAGADADAREEEEAAGTADQVTSNGEPAAAGADGPADGESTDTPWSWSVGSASFADGRLNFVDETLVIPFGTSVEDIGAQLSDLSSADDAPTRIVLDGDVPPNGTMRIETLLTLLDPLDDAVFEIRFRQVAMPQLSPYTGTFAGRRIAGGRLDLDLSYTLDDGALDAENRIVATALRLGPPVDSPDALDLPLELALALLRDSDDRIVLEIPVSGDVDDPSFDITPVIMSAIGNAITGIVSAPFRMLGSLLGGGGDETIDRVLFPLGSATITDAEAARFVSLETALNQRPALRLVIHPTRAPQADRDALRIDALEARIAAAAAPESAPRAASGADGDAGDEPPGPIDPAAEAAALRTLYARSYGEEALAAIVEQYEEGDAAQGGPGAVLEGELRGRLLADTRVSDEALETLARDRAQAVRDQLAAVGLDPGRIRIREAVVEGEVADDGERVIMKFDLAPGDAGDASQTAGESGNAGG